MHASFLLTLPLIHLATAQDFNIGNGGSSCQGTQVSNYCCDGSIINTSDQAANIGNDNGANSDLSILTCCVGDENNDIYLGIGGPKTCTAGSAAPLTQFAAGATATTGAASATGAAGSSTTLAESTTAAKSMSSASTATSETVEESTSSSSGMAMSTSSDMATSATSGAAVVSSSASGTAAAATTSGTSSSAAGAAMMTSGPIAGAFLVAGSFVMAAL